MTTKTMMPKLSYFNNRWHMQDGDCSGEGGSPQDAYNAYKAARFEHEAFHGNKVRDMAEDMLAAFKKISQLSDADMRTFDVARQIAVEIIEKAERK